jgi:membrane-associated protease RseP (regulator of RpoE activity)
MENTGFTFSDYTDEDFPAAEAGLLPNTLITGIDGLETTKFQDFTEELYCKNPGDQIIISSFDGEGNSKDYSLTLASNPDDEKKSFMGIINIKNDFEIKKEYNYGIWKMAYYSLDWINGFLKWLYVLSLGIGLFNLLPLPIVDGGRMIQVTLQKMKGKEKGNRRYGQIGLFFLVVLLLNLFFPLIQKAINFII